jgi:hypothetical protein
MTEQEWRECADPIVMILELPAPSEHKLRSFNLAWVDQKPSNSDHLLSDQPWNFAWGIVWEEATPVDKAAICSLLHEIFGNPFRPVTVDPAWLTPTVVSLAQAIYDEQAFDRLPILADALEDAGCTNADLLVHCRSQQEHARGCWAVDLVLGKS